MWRFVPTHTQQAEFAIGAASGPSAPLALTTRGNPRREFGLSQAFGRATERAKLGGWPFHDLRHFFATELFRNGASAVAIQQPPGHADLATTQWYADLDAHDLRSAITRIDDNGVVTARSDDVCEAVEERSKTERFCCRTGSPRPAPLTLC